MNTEYIPDFSEEYDAFEFACKHYQGRTQQYIKLADPELFKTLEKHDMLEQFPSNRHVSKEEVVEIFLSRYPNLTRGILAETNHGLYKKMRSRDALDYVPLTARGQKHVNTRQENIDEKIKAIEEEFEQQD